jgi:hypothetical protein
VRCVRCGTWPVDGNGVPPLAPSDEDFAEPPEDRVPWGPLKLAAVAGSTALAFLASVFGADVSWVSVAAIAAALVVVAQVAKWLLSRRVLRRNRFLELMRRVETIRAAPPHPIGRTTGEIAHVRGRLKVTRAVRESPRGPVGAYLVITRHVISHRETFKDQDGNERSVVHSQRVQAVDAACGRFAVIDDTGVAVVDDDAFDLWGAAFVRDGDREVLEITNGMLVDVHGPARFSDEPEAELADQPGAYRTRPRVLLFDARQDSRLLIFVPAQHDSRSPPGGGIDATAAAPNARRFRPDRSW